MTYSLSETAIELKEALKGTQWRVYRKKDDMVRIRRPIKGGYIELLIKPCEIFGGYDIYAIYNVIGIYAEKMEFEAISLYSGLFQAVMSWIMHFNKTMKVDSDKVKRKIKSWIMGGKIHR